MFLVEARFVAIEVELKETNALLREELKSGFSQILRELKKNERRLEESDRRWEESDRRWDKADRKFDSLMAQMARIYCTMGDGIEQMSSKWLQALMKERGILNPPIVVNQKFNDPEGKIHPGTKEVEVDVFCLDPPVLVECTTFLRYDEYEKLVNFWKIKQFLEERFGKSFEAYFVTFGISDEIKEKSYELMEKYNIKFIDAETKLK